MRHLIQIIIILTLFCSNLDAQNYKLFIQPENKLVESYQNFLGDSIEIKQKLKKLLNDLQNDGYLAAGLDSLQYDENEVFASIYIGRQYTWGKLDFNELEKGVIDDLRLNKKKFEIINMAELNKIRSDILRYYVNSGYPFAQVNFSDATIKDSSIYAKIKVNRGDYYTLDSIIIKGDAKISSSYIKKTIQLHQGEVFNQEKINDVTNQINNIRFLSEIKPAEIEFKEDQVDLYLYLQNKKANMFNGIIGFLPDPDNDREEETGRLLITGELNLNLVNPFGRGEEIYLQWEKMESSTQKLNVGFQYPYLLKTNIGFDFGFSLYKKDSTYLSLNTDLGLKLFLNPANYLKTYYRYKSSSRIGEEEDRSSSINYADVKSNIFGASYYLNKLDYRFNPRKGIEINVFAGAGFKNIVDSKNLDDSLNLNTDTRTIEAEAGLDLGFYYPIYKNIVFHFGNTTRYLDQFGNEEKDIVFFENELYRFGGAKSLRGFDESIFLASVYSLQNIEVRYLFEQNSAFYVFWNGAYYYKNVAQSVTEDFPWGFGIGMDFETKAGIFSLSYALGKQFENPVEIRTAKIHFGYISRF